ncbi:MAG: hypothetical protein ACK5L9_08205, partial [Paracoccus sp. (in: a-proteobacteria)]
FLADPQAVLTGAMRMMDAQAPPVTALPKMRDASGLPALLCKLRNSGLPIRLAGDMESAQETAASEGNQPE